MDRALAIQVRNPPLYSKMPKYISPKYRIFRIISANKSRKNTASRSYRKVNTLMISQKIGQIKLSTSNDNVLLYNSHSEHLVILCNYTNNHSSSIYNKVMKLYNKTGCNQVPEVYKLP